jgi:hypothetical protein
LRYLKDGFIDKKNSTHWGIDKSGEIYQFVPTAASAKAIGGGPRDRLWFSVENIAGPGESLTDQQVDTVSTLYAWLSLTQGLPLQEANKEAERGLGGHSIFGDDPNRKNCPGKNVLDQRPRILHLASIKRLVMF